MTDQLRKRANLFGYGIRLMLAAAVAVSASCGDLARQGRSPPYLIIVELASASGTSALNSDVVSATGVALNDIGSAS